MKEINQKNRKNRTYYLNANSVVVRRKDLELPDDFGDVFISLTNVNVTLKRLYFGSVRFNALCHIIMT